MCFLLLRRPGNFTGLTEKISYPIKRLFLLKTLLLTGSFEK